MHKELAKIGHADVIMARDAFLSVRISFQIKPCSFQAYHSPVLDEYDKSLERRKGTAAGADLIRQVLTVFDAESFSELEGRHAYIYREDEFSRIVKFGNLGVEKDLKTFDERAWKRLWELGDIPRGNEAPPLPEEEA